MSPDTPPRGEARKRVVIYHRELKGLIAAFGRTISSRLKPGRSGTESRPSGGSVIAPISARFTSCRTAQSIIRMEST
jgi:hypothetical protein